ncbi:hypothetical protein K3725_09755 [Leisingera sp. S132]|uniref:hypothetical protein n=1 Tax=Leisingera sp. S132 TaxID=2867016 RepID=UPI0021A5178D|nr:hypothetical protein [Leisingera sp. S132]UWQ77607.1 hypothetical protein K3725_09755 [Leisingera sp. S132]
MSDILAKLKSVHSDRKMVKVHVPEYGIDLFFPPLSLADHEAIRKGIRPDDEHALMVSGLIHQAKNADGTPAFPNEPAVKAELHRMEFAVVARVMREAAGEVGETANRELAGLNGEQLREAMLSVLKDCPELTAAVKDAKPHLLLYHLERIAAAHEAKQPLKNA